MAFSHGSVAKFFLNALNSSMYLSEVSMAGDVDTAEVTTLGNIAKQYVAGMEDATFKIKGFLDHNTVDTLSLDYQLHALGQVKNVPFTFIPQSDAVGSTVYAGTCVVTSHTIDTPVDDAASADFELQCNTGINGGKSLMPVTDATVDGNGGVLNNGASSANGAEFYLVVSSAAGTTPTVDVTIQGSADNITYAQIAAFSQVTTSRSAQVVKVTGTVPRYLKAVYDLGGTTPAYTIHVTVVRK
jgi:hypothetical protein